MNYWKLIKRQHCVKVIFSSVLTLRCENIIFFFFILSGCDIATSNGGWSIKTLKGVVSEAGAYLEKNMSDVLDMAEMSPIKEEEEEEEEKEEEDIQEDGEKHEEEETEKGNTQRRKVRET